MEAFAEILKYTLPSLIILIGLYLIFRQQTIQTKNNRKYELFSANQKTLTPLRLQAYERLILFLERSRFESIIMRVMNPSMSAKQLHRAMLADIRKEYNHNISQQLYVGKNAWASVNVVKEQLNRVLNLVAAKHPEGTATQLSQALIEYYNQMEKKPIETALEILKAEASENFGM